MSVGFIAPTVDIIPSIEQMEKELRITLSSDQIRLVTNIRDFANTQRKIVDMFINSYNIAVRNAFNSAFDDIINVLFPMVPVDTGRLRAGFLNSFSMHISINRLGDRTGVSTIEFDLAQLLNEVPYARFFISEITGQELIDEPTTGGTRPIELTLITDRLASIPAQLAMEMKAQGWDVLVGEARADAAKATATLSDLLSQTTGVRP